MGLLLNWFLSDRRRRKLIRNCSLTTGSYLKWRWFFCLSLSLSLSVSIYRSRRCRSVTLDQNDGGGVSGREKITRTDTAVLYFNSDLHSIKKKQKRKRKEKRNPTIHLLDLLASSWSSASIQRVSFTSQFLVLSWCWLNYRVFYWVLMSLASSW